MPAASTAQPRRYREQQAAERPSLGPYRPVTEPPRQQGSQRLVVTIATGATHMELLAMTRGSMQNYAERCDADFLELTDSTQDWPLYEKYRLRTIAERYEQTLFLDVDCLVRSTCPDLFARFPSGVAMRDDAPCWNADWMQNRWTEVMSSQGVARSLSQPIRAWNTGVVLCDRDHAFLWEPPERPLSDGHESEQVWVQATLQDRLVEVQDIGPGLNDQYYYPTFRDTLPQTQIAHFALCPDRLSEIAKLKAEWCQP